jgi:hypothetical protein
MKQTPSRRHADSRPQNSTTTPIDGSMVNEGHPGGGSNAYGKIEAAARGGLKIVVCTRLDAALRNSSVCREAAESGATSGALPCRIRCTTLRFARLLRAGCPAARLAGDHRKPRSRQACPAPGGGFGGGRRVLSGSSSSKPQRVGGWRGRPRLRTSAGTA